MDRKVLLGSVCAAAVVVAMGSNTPSAVAQEQIFGGGASLPSVVVRKLMNCFAIPIENTSGTPSFNDPFCSIPRGANAYVSYATVGSSRGREGFVAEDSRALARSQRPSTGVVIPYSSTAGSDYGTDIPSPPGFVDGDNTLPNGVLVFDDNRNTFSPDSNFDDPVTGPQQTGLAGLGFDPAPGPNPVGFWRLHYTTSEEPIFQSTAQGGSGVFRQTYDCYEGDASNNPNGRCNRNKEATNGKPLQIPLLAVGVTIAYNVPEFCDQPADVDPNCTSRSPLPRPPFPVKDPTQPVPTPSGQNRLVISEGAACGLFTGKIDSWSHRSISQYFNNPRLPDEAVTGVIVRADGSGTQFLFSSWLDAVCDGIGNVKFNGGANASPNYDQDVGIYEVPGNEGVANIVAANDWSVGFMTPGLTDLSSDEIDSAGFTATEIGTTGNTLTDAGGVKDTPVSARIINRAGKAQLPTSENVRETISVNSEPPRCNTNAGGNVVAGEPCLEPENWGLAFDVVDPVGRDTFYPIVGFNWLNLYECYQRRPVAQIIQEFLTFYYRQNRFQITRILENNGFANLPADWQSAVETIIVAGNTRPSGVAAFGNVNADCLGLAGAGRGWQPGFPPT